MGSACRLCTGFRPDAVSAIWPERAFGRSVIAVARLTYLVNYSPLRIKAVLGRPYLGDHICYLGRSSPGLDDSPIGETDADQRATYCCCHQYYLMWMIVVDILPDSLYVFQITFTQAVKVWKTEDVVLHSDIQGGRAGYSWDPLLGPVKRSLILLPNFPSKNKNRITDRYCSFSIFLKSADTSDSTRSQNKTTSPILLKFWQ